MPACTARASVGANPYANGIVGTADFGGASYWAGVDSVTINGTPIAGYTLSSLSGADWTQNFAPTGAP